MESLEVSGRDFTRAGHSPKRAKAFAPEGAACRESQEPEFKRPVTRARVSQLAGASGAVWLG
jgi:hypothetical protein